MNNIIRSLGCSMRLSNTMFNSCIRQMSMVQTNRLLCYATNKVHVMRPLNVRLGHTSGVEKQLQQFLDNEIKTEEQTSDKSRLPGTFEGFKVSSDGAEVELVKESPNEVIAVKFNINHSVSEEESKGNDVQLRSKPDFEVDINRHDVILGFNCSYANNFENEELDESNDDVFQIDEITIYENKYSENKYSLAGDTIDPDLYDLLMTFLAEKGISNSFVENLSDLSTSYEQKVYVKFLNDLRKFF